MMNAGSQDNPVLIHAPKSHGCLLMLTGAFSLSHGLGLSFSTGDVTQRQSLEVPGSIPGVAHSPSVPVQVLRELPMQVRLLRALIPPTLRVPSHTGNGWPYPYRPLRKSRRPASVKSCAPGNIQGAVVK